MSEFLYHATTSFSLTFNCCGGMAPRSPDVSPRQWAHYSVLSASHGNSSSGPHPCSESCDFPVPTQKAESNADGVEIGLGTAVNQEK